MLPFMVRQKGGGIRGLGTVYELQPPSRTVCLTAECGWNETILHSFQGGTQDGATPLYGNLTFDQTGNIYGTTSYGGVSNSGTVFQLAGDRGWMVHLLNSFSYFEGAYAPAAGVIFDPAGNLYGTTPFHGSGCVPPGCGTVFQLTPSVGNTWNLNFIVEFDGADGREPGGLITDGSGKFYGTTSTGGANNAGTVFEFTFSDQWVLTSLYSFSGCAPAGVTMKRSWQLVQISECPRSLGIG